MRMRNRNRNKRAEWNKMQAANRAKCTTRRVGWVGEGDSRGASAGSRGGAGSEGGSSSDGVAKAQAENLTERPVQAV